MYYHALAERLGWGSVDLMLDGMTAAELVRWMGYDELLARERDKQARLAKKGMRPRGFAGR